MSRRQLQLNIVKEAIQYQKDKTLFLTLIDLFTAFNQEGDTSREGFKKFANELSKAFRDVCNLNISVTIETGMFSQPNAYIRPPLINPSSPLWEPQKQIFKIDPAGVKRLFDQGMKAVRKELAPVQGTVDLRTGRAGGLYTKISAEMRISAKLFAYPDKGGIHFTPEEISAVVLHELGHLFSYYELMSRTLLTNYVLDGVVDALRGETDEEVRVRFIDVAAGALDTKVNAKALAKAKDNRTVQTVLCDAAVHSSASATRAISYSYRSFEFLADQFSTLQGAGKALATAVEKLTIYYNFDYSVRSRWTFSQYAITIIRTLLSVAMAPVVLPLLAMMLALPGLDEQVYDDPRDRLLRIKRQMIQATKDDRLSQEQRDDILQDIDGVEEAISHLREGGDSPFFMAVWRLMTSHRREQYAQQQIQQQLEALASNDLFIAGHKLASLSQNR